ncbi:PIN domain-containing protein [Acinetobacter sp. AOR15_HL]|uniref:type II toxin-antitoxin system VapC family toxin n=1 Tax=unclassified Acinetobacter TaxID=196816 RepID=UPI0022EA1B06|nr:MULTISPECIES: PIN domain-containing protein [unclassified Acinetobacter]MDA3556172.1 PIN domain-containing protein [Acinetobacter sp. AOR15_HL]MDA3571629.1 PIN domain-containing protein [Acinetobacter sp. AOR14_HL]
MSQIFNIKKVTPTKDDVYFIDTNVWFWFTYCGSNKKFIGRGPSVYQLKEYPAFIEKILNVGAKIFTSPLIYTELANLIERTEYTQYVLKNKVDKTTFSRKDFREIEECREKVLREINSAWNVICSVSSECLELNLNLATTKAAHNFMSTSTLDPYDAIFIHFMKSHQINTLISDDGDMMSTDISTIITANRHHI